MSLLIKLCDDYLNDRLSYEERRAFEERLAKGDKELAETFYQLKAFSKSRTIREFEESIQPNDQHEPNDELLTLIKKGDSQEPNPIKSETKPNHEGLAEVLTALEDKKMKKLKKASTYALSFLLFVSIGTVLYLQWETYLSKQKLEVMQKKMDSLQKERFELLETLRMNQFQIDRIKGLVIGDFFLLSKIPLKNNKGEWIQFWDRGTLRIAVWLNKPNIETPNKLQLESLNAKTSEWQQVGIIDRFSSDSLYTQWESQQLSRSIGLRVNELKMDQNGQTSKEILGEIRIK